MSEMALPDMKLWDRIITLFVQQTTPQGVHMRQQAMSHQHTTPPDPSRLLAELLSSSLLILEVACLAFSKPAAKHHSNTAITEQLWSLAAYKAQELAKIQSQAPTQSAVPDLTADPNLHTYATVSHRSLCLIHFLIPALRSYVKASHLVQAETCCFMLKAVVITEDTILHHTLVAEILKLGEHLAATSEVSCLALQCV